ncbi:RNA 2',3'-cyclic phosphodiesterase [Halomonas urumqiensis]|uniref:RNA 2',3'-cyclic phosphodiesterase n=1 Tax=Halomonas urumqiensis TaxID=1684789 RepID=A0A2N7UJL7_9GAMM|nr:RNA 2',3'-cyclic phosphodiesterase [Halomonas urumqiensis]PMR80636.1 RNA 2',3'-cyclic phosphodiesterase [Halomonas urumqiensis]PTB02928.1 RNA 2',3'-cyclic phosphodiesterase [Halomonas urumqiensis]
MRLFLALVPPPELRERLGRLADTAQASCGGRRMPEASLHLTLAFLGEVEAPEATALAEWVSQQRIPAGQWQLDRWGLFRRPGIVWVGSQAENSALKKLHTWLWDALDSQGYPGRPARFIPHITLLRRATCLDTTSLPDIRLDWTYTQFELVESVTDSHGAHYSSLAASIAP